MEKVAPSERFRRELDDVLVGVAGEQDPIEAIGRLGARLILQQALEPRHAAVAIAVGVYVHRPDDDRRILRRLEVVDRRLSAES